MSPRTLVATLGVVATALTTSTAVAQEQPLKTIREGVLDRIELFVDRPPRAADSIVAIKRFTTDAANLGTGVSGTKDEQQAARTMQTEAPKELEAAFMKALTSGGGFKGVVRDGPGDLVVEGSFTDINPGSLPKKGGVLGERSVVAVAGTVRDGSGKLLARFEQRRVAATRVLGADAVAKMRQDARNLGEDIAKFLKTWTGGKSLS
jgi:uncharacterized protein YbjQ (UPF0145 family)